MDVVDVVDVVVVGAGLAGAQVCTELRNQGHDGRITLLGDEGVAPYDRPPLSKEFLLGSPTDTTLDADLTSVETHLTCAVDSWSPGVVTSGDQSFTYDALVVATGARPRLLPALEGAVPQLPIRSVRDAAALRQVLVPGARVVLVGAGWIGAEVATAAVTAGCSVTVLEMGPAPLAATLGADVAAAVVPWWSSVDLRCGGAVDVVTPDGVRLADGSTVPADVVVPGIGVRPHTPWLPFGLDTDGWGRTSEPGVWAVGDCSRRWSARYGTHLGGEHWDDALQMPATLVGALLGRDVPAYDPVPYVWSDQWGRRLQWAGRRSGDPLWRGSPKDASWSVCWLADGVLTAVLAVGRPKDLLQGRRAVGRAMDPARLADPSIAVKDAVTAA